MTLSEFKKSLHQSTPPELTTLLKAMWYDARGEWNTAHDLTQDVNTRDGSWIHAYLHRKEGDLANAQYWYNRAHQKMPGYSLEQEWEEIIKTLLNSLRE